VFIPIDWIIGGREQAGKGWRMLMEALAAGRSISLPALATGAGKLTARATGAYARVREQFHLPVGRFEGVAEALARIAGRTYQMEATRALTAAAVANGERPGVLTAIAKYHLTETMRGVVNDGMDVHGGKAICVGPSNLMARAYQAVPIGITVEGANILTRSMIVFGQGAIRCHPHLLAEMEAAEAGDARAFDRAFTAHAGFTVSNAVRALVLGLTGGRLARAPGPKATRPALRRLTRLSAAFALTADTALLTLGGALKRRESLSARLGDCLSHLYMASAVVRHFHERGAPDAELPLARWALADHEYRAREALAGFYANFPVRPAAWALRALAFPFGVRLAPPSDRDGQAAADTLLASGAARDALTDGIYLPTESGEPLADLEQALAAAESAEPVERALRQAVKAGRLERGARMVERAVTSGIIDNEGAEALRAAEAARQRVIAVDDFAPALGRGDAAQGGRVRSEG
jgi:acyl-CoA dehydrogenase